MRGKYEIEIKGQGLGTDLQGWLVPKVIEEALAAYEVPLNLLAPVEEKVASYRPEECVFPETGQYPVRNAEEVKVAEARLIEQHRRLRPETRARAFAKLAEAAETHGVPLRPEALRWSGSAVTDRGALTDTLAARASLAKTAEHRDAYLRVAEAVVYDRNGLLDHASRVKLAEAIGDLDEAAGLSKYYDRKIPDPVAAVFNSSVKLSAHMLDLGGHLVDSTKLGSLPASFFADALGTDFLSEVAPRGVVDAQKVAEVLTTLPADMKQDFARQLKAAGVPVVAG